ncbi:hypothetical protein ACFLU6_05665, partial [Acidobacteriota bacterium]
MNESPFWMSAIWLIPVFPALGALINGIFGTFLPKRLVHWIGCGTIGISLLFSMVAVYQLYTFEAPVTDEHHGGLTKIPLSAPVGEAYFVPERRAYVLDAWDWIPAGFATTTNGLLAKFHISWGFRLDPLSAVMLFVVTFVGFFIHVYSIGYMWEEKDY